jgi:transcriptional regulator GlxA family with amidase domain
MSNPKISLELSAITDWETRGRNAGWRVKALANDCGVCPRSLQRFWKKERQIPLAKWLVEQRFALACHLLRATNETIEGVSQLVAYRHIGAFSHAFGLRYGMTPSKWRQVFVNNQPASQAQEKDPQLVSWSRLQSMRFVARS